MNTRLAFQPGINASQLPRPRLRFGKIQFVLILVAGALAAWEFRHSLNLRAELAAATVQVAAQRQELESGRQALEASEQRNRELQEAERRAGNQTLLSLMKERNGFSMAASEAAAQAAEKSHPFGAALAKTLDSSEHRQANEASRRAEMRVGLYQFFKLLNLSPEKREAYIDLNIQQERRQADRLSALLQGRMTVADALVERANDEAEDERRNREVLGDKGVSFLNGIAEGMRNNEAKRLLGLIQDNMRDNQLSRDQSDRLQALLKTEVVTINMDDIELFRPPEEWTQDILSRQGRILNAATTFLTVTQLETLKSLGAADLAERQNQMATRRTALGIK
jgi:hypothetical protein